MVKRGGVVDLFDGAEEDGSGDNASARKETSQGEHEVQLEEAGPKHQDGAVMAQ